MSHSPPMFSSQRHLKPVENFIPKLEHHCRKHDGMPSTFSASYTQSYNEKPSPVYVHHFKRVPSVVNRAISFERGNYDRVQQEYYNSKLRTCKKQFDSLTLSPKSMQKHVSSFRVTKPNKEPNGKIMHAKSNSNAKIYKYLLKPEHKAIADKLEETYWTKWKPNKTQVQETTLHKTKGLYTENEKIYVPNDFSISKKKERGDSNEAINTSKSDVDQNHSLVKILQIKSSHMLEDPDQESEDEEDQEEVEITESSDLVETSSDIEVSHLKHTDSLILTSRKKSTDRTHYQQPKCIKLFKNAGYTTSTSTNYIKGGTYPLKSCLKKEKAHIKTVPSSFGANNSPIKLITNKRPGKANRFTT